MLLIDQLYAKVVEIGRGALQKYPDHGNSFSTRAVMAEALVRMKDAAGADGSVGECYRNACG